MKEQIYTIPVTEAFEKSALDKSCGCPFCTMLEVLQKNEIELIMGASMMEPDIRIQTNKLGFCRKHFDMMLAMHNRLGLALMLESHLDEVKDKIMDKKGISSLFTGKGPKESELVRLADSCYVCGRIDFHIDKMFECAVYLWERERDFRALCEKQPFFCIPHQAKLMETARIKLGKKTFPDFAAAIAEVQNRYLSELCEDVAWFTKKFDYRYQDEPWKNAKDAPERAVAFLSGRK